MPFVRGSIYGNVFPLNFYHEYFASLQRAASFQGVGPSISWNASAPIGGQPDSGEVALDWGVNAAVLFGRQKARTHHQSSGSYRYYPPGDITAIDMVPLPTHHGTAIGPVRSWCRILVALRACRSSTIAPV